jgi:hypothetical protein
MDAPRASPAEVSLCRQSTMEFIGTLLKGVDTPDEPLPQLFDGGAACAVKSI